MDRRDNYGGRGRGRESGGTGGGRGWGQGHGRGRGRGSSDQPPYSTNRGGRGQGQGHGQGRGRGRGSWDQPRPSLPERISETPATGRGRGSWDQPRPSLPERISETPATVLATEMDDALTISTSEFHTAEGASSSIDGEDGIWVDARRRRRGKWRPSPQEHISNTIAAVVAREMKTMAISTSALPTSEGASSSISMASTKESAGSAHIPSNSVSLESIPSSRETKEETGQIRRSALVPMNRPKPVDVYPKQPISLLVNHFCVNFDRDRKIYHYDFDIQRVDKKEKRGSGKTEKEMQESGVSDTSENKNGPVSRISKEDALKIKNKMVQDNIAGFGNANIVFDGQKNIYSVESLPEGNYPVELPTEEGAVKKFKVALKNTGHELNGRPLFKFLDTNEKNHMVLNADLLQCLNLVMREYPSRNRFLLGGSLYRKISEQHVEIPGRAAEDTGDPEMKDISDGAVASSGFYQSLRPTAQGLVLNVDFSAIALLKKISVIKYVQERCGMRFKDTTAFSIEDVRRVSKALVGLKVKVTHRRCSQKFTIRGLTAQRTSEIRFLWSPDNRPQEMNSVPEFFSKKYGRPIKYELWPCLDIGKNSEDKPNYIPMEVCDLCEGQRLHRDNFSPVEKKKFDDIARLDAEKRRQKINNIMLRPDGPKGGPFLPAFRLEVDGRMTEVEGRVLEAPTLQLGIKSVKKGQVIPHQKKWNLMNNHVFDGKRIEKWGLICFSNARNDRDLEHWHNNFKYALIRRCEEVGMSMNPTPLVWEYQPMSYFNDNEALKQTLLKVDTKAKGELQILICSMEEKHEGYKTLKLIAETYIGLVTQCCLFEHVKKCSDPQSKKQASQYLANLALKMNAKVGGSNVALFRSLSRLVPQLGDGHVMCIGADVNHPGFKDEKSPSIAAVVGSINWPYYNRYNARLSYQKSRVEHIEKLKGMSKELLDDYIKANKRLPDRILFFRDGVSESQFDMVLNEELVALKEAVAQFKNYIPRVSFIVAQKRHHTRLFPSQRPGNVPPGTVVDTVIVHPRQFDFYLCSHEGLQGTSKPTHYHVLWDENNFSSHELETLINNLCYTFARCTRPVSLVPPVYYADLAAYRGRLHFQAFQELPIKDVIYPELHDRVKNNMFFC